MQINTDFKRANSNVKLPPDYLIYESFQMNYNKYYSESIDSAKWLANHFSKYIELKGKKILDWGCGPGRIIRHLPSLISNSCEFYGTDYNIESIEWCNKNLPDIKFNYNTLNPDLPYPDNFFDIIYGISIFTHLSEKSHYNWYNELYRVLKYDGIMLLTTQGDNFKVKLTDPELKRYNNDELIVRDKAKEGHRTYSTFHPPAFIKNLFNNTEILDHIEEKSENGKWLPQDIWIIKKPSA
jgi:ubiquinone/menaquinone biosynthesis C-methylase UbiE